MLVREVGVALLHQSSGQGGLPAARDPGQKQAPLRGTDDTGMDIQQIMGAVDDESRDQVLDHGNDEPDIVTPALGLAVLRHQVAPLYLGHAEFGIRRRGAVPSSAR